MSKGVVIYAYNSTFDYVAAAEFAAKQVKKYLGLPVTLITDVNSQSPAFDRVITCAARPGNTRMLLGSTEVAYEWKNQNRSTAYDLSPYDQTLLIDADYFMFNDSLKCLFDSNLEFSCAERVIDVSGKVPELTRVSQISIPMCWATVIYFTKCEFSKTVFAFIETIRNNWQYYSMLYNFTGGVFRNDFALSIALHSLSGFGNSGYTRLPIKLHTVFPHTEILEVRGNEIVFTTDKGINKITDTNLHIINKFAWSKFYAG